MKAALDFLLRLAFFATVPFVLVLVAAIFPVTGALAQVAIGLVGIFTGEAMAATHLMFPLIFPPLLFATL